MNKEKKTKLIWALALTILTAGWTVIVKTVDIYPAAIMNSNIGLAHFNAAIYNALGSYDLCYYASEVLGYIAIAFMVFYAVKGLLNLIEVKKLSAVKSVFFVIAGIYILGLITDVFFEKVFVINLRPVITDKIFDGSYPSSHTLRSIIVFGTSMITAKEFFNSKIRKICYIVCPFLIIATIITRLLSGMHWPTDIIGGIIFGITYLSYLEFALCFTDTEI